ncbi:hypothetical protein QVD17_14639 [Tagetes erecta]|uniref:Uncharacterized protein n=1 Tax=Tagetes erecta TaxID=13708 RepID=A0AAD8NYU5_TARER|nr:hypothetical protein QVD17_14639 [Tagetes erecta]
MSFSYERDLFPPALKIFYFTFHFPPSSIPSRQPAPPLPPSSIDIFTCTTSRAAPRIHLSRRSSSPPLPPLLATTNTTFTYEAPQLLEHLNHNTISQVSPSFFSPSIDFSV